MAQSLIREANHNVVLRSDNVALRFFHRWGGAPNEWWSEPFPLVSNPFPGSGVSINFETGQDPTQASSNGITENPICVGSDITSQKYNYYARESLFDGAGNYGVTGFLPDFWLSDESIDDAIAPNPGGSDHGWRTRYAPGAFAAQLADVSVPVIFQGTGTNWSGLFFIGDEMKPISNSWNHRLRNYGEGRIAAKTTISLANANLGSFAGLCFRKSVTQSAGASKHDAFVAPGIHLYVAHNGNWSINKMDYGQATPLKVGQLSPAQHSKLLGAGLQVEIRTHNGLPNEIYVLFDDVQVATIQAAGCNRGPHVCLFASTSSGHVVFSYRQFFHVGVQSEALYSAKPDGTIVSDLRVTKLVPDSSTVFYRANLPGFFLNKDTFPVQNRKCLGFKDGSWHDIDGVYNLSDYQKYYAGNLEGTCGVVASFESVEINGSFSPHAHLMICKRVVNDEFVMMLNPLPIGANDAPMAIQSMRIKTRWQTRIV